MQRPTILASTVATLLLAGCGPTQDTTLADFSTPETAVHTLIDAARAGDNAGAHAALVQREREGDGTLDYGEMNAYEITRTDRLGENRAVVYVQMEGLVTQPMVCEREDGEWHVTIWGSLELMQKMVPDQATPR